MACGNLPFARPNDDVDWIKSVYVSPHVLEALKTGRNITDLPDNAFPKAIEYLRRLPTLNSAQAWPHYGTEKSKDESGEMGLIKKCDGEIAGKWCRAVSGIAFGGLVPQSTIELKDAVAFTLSGLPAVIPVEDANDIPEEPSNDCKGQLERLVNKVHLQDENLNLFGKYVAARASWQDACFATDCYNTRDAAAVFARYMTLLERLTALCEHQEENPKDQMQRVYERTCEILEKSYKRAVDQKVQSSSEDVGKILGKVVRDIRKRFKISPDHCVISLDDCATIAACIIAAWAQNVQIIKLRPDRFDHECLREEAYMEDLPSMLAFG